MASVGVARTRCKRVLVACHDGVGRTRLASWVLVSRGMRPLETLAAAKQARPQVSPSLTQLEALATWAARWIEWHRS
jgi:hypothetical protein